MKQVLITVGLALSLVGRVYAMNGDDQPTSTPNRAGRWENNANGISQAANVRINSDGSTSIGVSVQGGNPGSPGSTVPSGSRILENPRGGGNSNGPGISRGASSSNSSSSQVVLEPSTGGANTFASGPISTETLANGTVVTQFGGVGIGGWSFPTLPTAPAVTTNFAPIGPVTHIDPWSLAVSAEHEAAPPPITLKANPDPGVVAVPTWFWVAGYDGHVITHSKTQSASHTECRLLNGAPDCHTVDDSVTVTVHLTPKSYTWSFGDGRTGSVQTFPPGDGLGRPYTDPLHESPVRWSYEFDSRDFASGFPIKLTIAFAGTFEANGSGPQALPERDVSWTAGLVMRQVQTLNGTRSSSGEAPAAARQR